MIFYAATIFISAFLLFLIQPIIGRLILPWFGGAAAVWITCLLFFQLILLLGYVYAHSLTRRLRPAGQAVLHAALLAASLLLLPIHASERWKSATAGDPTLRILLLLSVTIGLPYFLLSATNPLLQAWYSRRHEGAMPYRLFALSNGACLLALLAYPSLVEPALSNRTQTRWWSAGYAFFALICGAVALRESGGAWLYPASELAGRPVGSDVRAAGDVERPLALWTAQAACGAILLLAVTNYLTKNVAPIPFLWILPLTIYLLTLILCFDHTRWYNRAIYLRLLAVSLAALVYGVFMKTQVASMVVVIVLFSALLFICCMVSHGELARSKPAPQHLTSFYLSIALGGAAGGAFVVLVAPHLFNDYFELPIGIGLCALLPVLSASPQARKTIGGSAGKRALIGAAGLAILAILALASPIRAALGGPRVQVRNFYGSIQISDADLKTPGIAARALINNGIIHGEQFLNPRRRGQPTAYYGEQSGVGLEIRQLQSQKSVSVGAVGLGAGVLAAYGRPGDVFRFYEINPLVVRVAQSEFTFLRDSRAQVEIVESDGRLALEREPERHYDLLVVDAFSGDSVPVHLLTREAFALYFQRLKEGGVLAVHVTNTYLDLAPVAGLAARMLGAEAVFVRSQADKANRVFTAEWVLASKKREVLTPLLSSGKGREIETAPGLRLWTDNYSNLLSIMR